MTIIDAPPFTRCDWLLTIPKARARLQAGLLDQVKETVTTC